MLFADIVGFTPLAEQLAANDLVAMLNQVFARWDQLAAKHGVEKIKTIGDAYMAASGVPVPRLDHAQAIAEMALAMGPELAHRDRYRPAAAGANRRRQRTGRGRRDRARQIYL